MRAVYIDLFLGLEEDEMEKATRTIWNRKALRPFINFFKDKIAFRVRCTKTYYALRSTCRQLRQLLPRVFDGEYFNAVIFPEFQRFCNWYGRTSVAHYQHWYFCGTDTCVDARFGTIGAIGIRTPKRIVGSIFDGSDEWKRLFYENGNVRDWTTLLREHRNEIENRLGFRPKKRVKK